MAQRNEGRPRVGSPADEPSAPDLFSPAPLPVAPLDAAGRLACLRLIRSENVGPVTFRELVNRFGGAQQALDALPEIARRAGRGRPIAVCPAARAEAELAAAERHGAQPVFTIEPGYPAALASLDAAPPMLYVKGRRELLARPMVAIVGARNGSAAGTRMARLLADGLGAAGYVVVSGLARGIDTAAHEAALAAGTVAVLAGGIDLVYPPENAELQARIAESGCLLSEMLPGFQPRAQDFPRRNRIISGVSLGVIVVEAARRSGSLITARTANEQGRLVMAVPGHPLDPRAEGPNGLIRDGALMVRSIEDVLPELAPMTRTPFSQRAGPAMEEAGTPELARDDMAHGGTSGLDALSSAMAATPPPSDATDPITAVLGVLGPAPVSLDEIARAARLPVHLARVALTELSLAGRVELHGGQLVSLRPDGGA